MAYGVLYQYLIDIRNVNQSHRDKMKNQYGGGEGVRGNCKKTNNFRDIFCKKHCQFNKKRGGRPKGVLFAPSCDICNRGMSSMFTIHPPPLSDPS